MFFSPMNSTKPRRFEYQFRFQKTEQDKEKRIEFRRILKSPEPRGGSLVRLFIMVILVVITFIYLSKTGGPRTFKNVQKPEPFKVEEIIVVD